MKYTLKPYTCSVNIDHVLSLFRLLSAPYTLQFLLHSSNCAIKIQEGTAQFETMQFPLHTCTKISRNYVQFTVNIGNFTIAENFVMTSTEETTCYVNIATDVGRKNKARVISFFYTNIMICRVCYKCICSVGTGS
jgi:hypothetical protein